MLVLTRKPGEEIIIGGNIRITGVNVGPGRGKIGSEAPPDVRVDRQEVYEKKLTEQVALQAAEAVPAPVVVEPKPVPALHNRIAEKLPVADLDPPTAASPQLENRLKQIARRY